MHTDHIVCNNVTLNVSLAGNDRARLIKQRNVHAFVVSDNFTLVMDDKQHTDLREITYNPFRHTSFVFKDDDTVVDGPCTLLLLRGKLYQLPNEYVGDIE